MLPVCLAGAPRRPRAQELFVQLALCTASGEAAQMRTSRDGSLPGEELSGSVEADLTSVSRH